MIVPYLIVEVPGTIMLLWLEVLLSPEVDWFIKKAAAADTA